MRTGKAGVLLQSGVLALTLAALVIASHGAVD